jgi:hypothetical protein
MDVAVKITLAEVRTALGQVEALDVEALPPLIAARLLIELEGLRANLQRAVDAARAASPAGQDAGPLYRPR